MRRYLVVANQTLGGDHLLERLRQCVADGPSEFYVVVPATHGHEHLTWTEGEARAIAARNLARALERFDREGFTCDGEVGAESVTTSIEAVLHERSFDAIIISTLPAGVSKWLRQDLPSRIERRFGLPVVHVTAVAEPA